MPAPSISLDAPVDLNSIVYDLNGLIPHAPPAAPVVPENDPVTG